MAGRETTFLMELAFSGALIPALAQVHEPHAGPAGEYLLCLSGRISTRLTKVPLRISRTVTTTCATSSGCIFQSAPAGVPKSSVLTLPYDGADPNVFMTTIQEHGFT